MVAPECGTVCGRRYPAVPPESPAPGALAGSRRTALPPAGRPGLLAPRGLDLDGVLLDLGLRAGLRAAETRPPNKTFAALGSVDVATAVATAIQIATTDNHDRSDAHVMLNLAAWPLLFVSDVSCCIIRDGVAWYRATLCICESS